MRPSKFTDEQVTQALAQVAAGTPLAAMCRKLGVTPTTFYRWRRKFGRVGATGPNETRVLRDENNRLKQLVADLSLQGQALRATLTSRAKPARAGNE